MDPWGLGWALRRLALVTFLTATGPVAFDAHLVGFLVPTSGPFREDLKGDVTARACRFLYPDPLCACFTKEETADSEGEGRALWAISLLSTKAIISFIGVSSMPAMRSTSLLMSVS